MKEQKKVFIKTLGCQMNEYDSQKMHEVLDEHFHTVKTDDYKNADIILINTSYILAKNVFLRGLLFHNKRPPIKSIILSTPEVYA